MPLTWRSVSAPDFSSSIGALRASNEMFSRALDGARGAVQDIEDDRSDRVDAAFLAEMNRFGNAEELQAALGNSPTLGFKGVSAEALELAGRRGSVLLQQEAQRTANETNRFDLGQRQGAVSRLDAASPRMRELLTLAANGQYAEAVKGAADLGLRGDEFGAFIGDIRGATTGKQGIDGTAQDQIQSATRFGWEVANEDTRKEAETAIAIARKGALTESDALAQLNNMDISPEAYNLAVTGLRLPGLLSDAATGGGGSTGGLGGGAGGGDPYNTRFGFDRFTAPPKALTEMTMGEVYDYGQNVLRPETRAAGFGKTSDGKVVGTSAVGAYQFVGGTMAKYAEQLFGKDWKNKQFTPEAQDAMAEALFNDTKRGNLKKIWEGLPDSRPGAYANRSWADVRAEILQHEVGVSPRELAITQAVGDVGRTQALNNVASNPTIKSYYDNAGFGGDAFAALAQYEGDAAFEGVPQSKLVGSMDKIIARAGQKGVTLNYAQAAAILRGSLTQRGFVDGLIDEINFAPGIFGTSKFKEGFTLDNEKIDTAIKTIKSGAAQNAYVSQASIAVSAKEQAAVTQAYQSAQANFQEAQRRGLPAGVQQRYYNEMVRATQAYLTMQATQGNSPDLGLFTPQNAPSAPKRPVSNRLAQYAATKTQRQAAAARTSKRKASNERLNKAEEALRKALEQ